MINSDFNFSELGPLIRFHRKAAGLSLQQLAGLAGVGKTVVFDVEHGKQSLRFDILQKILKVLNIHLQFSSPLMKNFEASYGKKS